MCTFVDCPNGTGYVQVAVRQLRASGFTVTLSNLGIPTAVIGPDFQALSAQYRPSAPVFGNYIEQEMPFVNKDTTVVTIFAGGNESQYDHRGARRRRGAGISSGT
jgi:hypothetical protein